MVANRHSRFRPWSASDRERRQPPARPSSPLSARLCRIELRPAAGLGETEVPGVAGRHHFCFAAHQHPDRISWGALRAIHHYRIAPWAERPRTFHAGFEIVTIVLAGRWKRTGSLPATVPLSANEAELVSTGIGTGLGAVPCGGSEVSLVEIWVTPQYQHGEPRRQWLARRRSDLSRPIATGLPAQADALLWDSAARLHYGWLEQGERFRSQLDDSERGYLLIVDGTASVNGITVETGDGAAATGPGRLELLAAQRARLVWLRGL